MSPLPKPTICLSMIVKNEAPVIARCLESVKPLIDSWVISDTGSTDGTQDIIRRTMDGIPGCLMERPWVDFSTNRNEALTEARRRADWVFIIDADETLAIGPDFVRPDPDGPFASFMVECRYGGMHYSRKQLVAARHPWHYKGVLHEFVTTDTPGLADSTIPGLLVNVFHEGARARDPSTYLRDAAVLEEALMGETDELLKTRYAFYLAQTYKDARQPEKALFAYLRRAAMGNWSEERYIACLFSGRLMDGLGFQPDVRLAMYEEARRLNPMRAEALIEMARIYRLSGRFKEILELPVPMTPPPGALFVEHWIYDYGLMVERGLAFYGTGAHSEAVSVYETVLASTSIAGPDRDQVSMNMGMAIMAQKSAAAPGAAA